MIRKFTITLLLLSTFYITSVTLASNDCGDITNPRAQGLVTSPNFQLGSKFGTTGSCIIDPKTAFAPYKINSYEELKSIYFDQAKQSAMITKITLSPGDKNQNDIASTASTTCLEAGSAASTPVADNLYYINGSLNLTAPVSGNQNKVIFVERNLTIGDPNPASTFTQLTYGTAYTGIIFIVGGNVNINQSIRQIDAMIIAGGTICTAFDGTCPIINTATKSNNTPIQPLIVNGSLISLNGNNPIKFKRSLTDNSQPAEIINNQVKYLVALRNLMSGTSQRWSEISANEPVPSSAPAPLPGTITTPPTSTADLVCNPPCRQDTSGNWVQNSYYDSSSCGVRLCTVPARTTCPTDPNQCHGNIIGYNGSSCTPTLMCFSNAASFTSPTSPTGQAMVCGGNNINACTPAGAPLGMNSTVTPPRRYYYNGTATGETCDKGTCDFPYAGNNQQGTVCGSRTTVATTGVVNDSMGCKRPGPDGTPARFPAADNVLGQYYSGSLCTKSDCSPNPQAVCASYDNSCHGDIYIFNGLECTTTTASSLCPANYSSYTNFSTQTQASICGANNTTACTGTGNNVNSFSPGSNTSNAINSTGLVGYWNFDDGTGSQASDLSGYGNVGALQNSPAWSSLVSKFGNALSFNTASSVISLTNSIPVNGSSYTISAWVNFPLPATTGGWRTLTRGITADHQVIVNSAGLLGVYDNAGGGFRNSGYNTNGLTGWHLLTAIASGTTTNFYIDASYVGQSPFKSNAQISYIGNYQGGGQNFGLIDEMKIYSRAITASEVTALFNATPDALSSCGRTPCQFPYYSSGNHDAVCGITTSGPINSKPGPFDTSSGCTFDSAANTSTQKPYYQGNSCSRSGTCSWPKPSFDCAALADSCHDILYGYDGTDCNPNKQVCAANFTTWSGYSTVSSSVCGSSNIDGCVNGQLRTYQPTTTCSQGGTSGTCGYPYSPAPGQQASVCGSRTGTSPNYHDSTGCNPNTGLLYQYYPGDRCDQINCYPNPQGNCMTSCHADSPTVFSGAATGNVCGTQTCDQNLVGGIGYYATDYSQSAVCGANNMNACVTPTDANITFTGGIRQYYTGGATGSACNKASCGFPSNHDAICGATTSGPINSKPGPFDAAKACASATSTTTKTYYTGASCTATNYCKFPVPSFICANYTNSCHGDLIGYDGTSCNDQAVVCPSNASTYENQVATCGASNEKSCYLDGGVWQRHTYNNGTGTGLACNTSTCGYPLINQTAVCGNRTGTSPNENDSKGCKTSTGADAAAPATGNYYGTYYTGSACTQTDCKPNPTGTCSACRATDEHGKFNGTSCTTELSCPANVGTVHPSTCTTGSTSGDCSAAACHGANDTNYRCWSGTSCTKDGYCPSTYHAATDTTTIPACRTVAFDYYNSSSCSANTTTYGANCTTSCNSIALTDNNGVSHAANTSCYTNSSATYSWAANNDPNYRPFWFTDYWKDKSTIPETNFVKNSLQFMGVVSPIEVEDADENNDRSCYEYTVWGCERAKISAAMDANLTIGYSSNVPFSGRRKPTTYGPDMTEQVDCRAAENTKIGYQYCHNDRTGIAP